MDKKQLQKIADKAYEEEKDYKGSISAGGYNPVKCPKHKLMVKMDGPYGPYYRCELYPDCDYQCSIRNGKIQKPTNQALRNLRKLTHEIFDELWKDKKYGKTRTEAYKILQFLMLMSEKEAHIGYFTEKQCKQAMARIVVYQKLHKYFME